VPGSLSGLSAGHYIKLCGVSHAVCLQKVVYTFTPIGLLLTALGVAWVVLVP